jgi:signal transduction histidine kinase
MLRLVNLPYQIKMAVRKALGMTDSGPRPEYWRLQSGSPSQIIQSTFAQLFELISPKLVLLLVEELNSGRMFLWHSDLRKEGYSVVNSEEFDHSTADEYLKLLPPENWIFNVRDAYAPLVSFDSDGRKLGRSKMPEALVKTFGVYGVVMSVLVDLGDEWRGRYVVCDPEIERSSRATLDFIRRFSRSTSRSIHAAHICLRACRETAAEERARLARELHDSTIQSMLGVELRLESLKRRVDEDLQKDLGEVQGILRREAAELRNMVNDSRRRALRPERLLEFLSDLLERFQRDTGLVTRFFADLDNKDPMPPRICHEIARLAEEGINNAYRHSKASTFTVRVGSMEGNWMLVMVDDGVGFDFHGTWSLERLVTAGVGPKVIKDRVLSLNGNLMIESTPAGARIEITIPKGNAINPFQTLTLSKQRQNESYSSSNR